MAVTFPLTTPENFDRQATLVSRYIGRPARLFEIRLPAGDHAGFSIDFSGATGLTQLRSADWLSRGYEGVRIVGAGIDRTHLRGNWFGWTIFSERHNGILQFEEMTIHGGSSWGGSAHIGLQNLNRTAPHRGFLFRLWNAKVVGDPPTSGGSRGKFLLFGYNRDEHLKSVILDGTELREHDDYDHGSAKHGSLWEDVEVWGAGAQCDKVRADASETAWAGRAVWHIRKRCTFKSWHQPWSDRGGAACVRESGAANELFEDCTFWGGAAAGHIQPNARSHAIMVSAEGNSYDILTGGVGGGFGNGYVAIRRCLAQGHSDVPWNNELISIYRNGGGKTARGVLIEDCGLFGQGMIVKLGSDIPRGMVVVKGCNTPEIRERAARLGMNVTHEATLDGRPVSDGLIR